MSKDDETSAEGEAKQGGDPNALQVCSEAPVEGPKPEPIATCPRHGAVNPIHVGGKQFCEECLSEFLHRSSVHVLEWVVGEQPEIKQDEEAGS